MWRDRGAYVTGAALVGIAGLAWVGVVLQGMSMQGGASGADALVSLSGAAVFVAAWGVMMAAMMLPSATPMIVLYQQGSRGLSQSDHHAVPTAVFASVYLTIWVGLGAIVYIGGLALNALGHPSPIVAAWFLFALASVLCPACPSQFTTLMQSCFRQFLTP